MAFGYFITWKDFPGIRHNYVETSLRGGSNSQPVLLRPRPRFNVVNKMYLITTMNITFEHSNNQSTQCDNAENTLTVTYVSTTPLTFYGQSRLHVVSKFSNQIH